MERELATLTEQITALRARWTREREAISRISDLKKKIEALRFEAEEQTRKGQLERAAQIQYGELPRLEVELKQLNAAQDGNAGVARMLKEEVDEEDIAGIVSKWTGIPVSRMLEGEVKKLVEMEAASAGARRRPGCGTDHRGECDPAFPRGPERSAPSHRLLHLSWTHRRGQD